MSSLYIMRQPYSKNTKGLAPKEKCLNSLRIKTLIVLLYRLACLCQSTYCGSGGSKTLKIAEYHKISIRCIPAEYKITT